jgi:hypothetical protein
MCSSYLQFPVFYRITVANADLAMARGETDTALNILRTVGPEQPYYIQANAFMYNFAGYSVYVWINSAQWNVCIVFVLL